ANFSGDKDALDVARIHEIHDGSWRIVQRPDVETIGPQDEDVRLFPGLSVPTLPSRLAQRAPSMVANSRTSRHVNSGGRFCSPLPPFGRTKWRCARGVNRMSVKKSEEGVPG